MVAALYSSRAGGTKAFERHGITFGWASIVRMWERDMEKTDSCSGRQLTDLPGMKKTYIQRDSWTRLNVKPAKIMQVSEYLFCKKNFYVHVCIYYAARPCPTSTGC